MNRPVRPRFGVAGARLQRRHPAVGSVLDARRWQDGRRFQDRRPTRGPAREEPSRIDTFQFFGPNDTPGLVDFHVEWEATGPAVARGLGATVAPANPGAFLGEFAPAISRGSFSGAGDRVRVRGQPRSKQFSARIRTTRPGTERRLPVTRHAGRGRRASARVPWSERPAYSDGAVSASREPRSRRDR